MVKTMLFCTILNYESNTTRISTLGRNSVFLVTLNVIKMIELFRLGGKSECKGPWGTERRDLHSDALRVTDCPLWPGTAQTLLPSQTLPVVAALIH